MITSSNEIVQRQILIAALLDAAETQWAYRGDTNAYYVAQKRANRNMDTYDLMRSLATVVESMTSMENTLARMLAYGYNMLNLSPSTMLRKATGSEVGKVRESILESAYVFTAGGHPKILSRPEVPLIAVKSQTKPTKKHMQRAALLVEIERLRLRRGTSLRNRSPFDNDFAQALAAAHKARFTYKVLKAAGDMSEGSLKKWLKLGYAVAGAEVGAEFPEEYNDLIISQGDPNDLEVDDL